MTQSRWRGPSFLQSHWRRRSSSGAVLQIPIGTRSTGAVTQLSWCWPRSHQGFLSTGPLPHVSSSVNVDAEFGELQYFIKIPKGIFCKTPNDISSILQCTGTINSHLAIALIYIFSLCMQ